MDSNKKIIDNCQFCKWIVVNLINGGLAQLARASALHAEGQRFESVILHREANPKEVGFFIAKIQKNRRC